MELSTIKRNITRVKDGLSNTVFDDLAIEEPLEIQLEYGALTNRQCKSISITMRTPVHDKDLAIGFLYTEGIITKAEDVIAIKNAESWMSENPNNVIIVQLKPDVVVDLNRLERHFYTSSSCGVCGKSSIDALKTVRMPILKQGEPKVNKDTILLLPETLRKSQEVFDSTGGLHASAIFNTKGEMLLVREDVGRHNAVDKLAGAALMNKLIPLNNHIILFSGRASFELVQKSAMMNIAIMAAVGAPSSLAASLAEEAGMTLIGFLREGRFNIYTHSERINE